MNSIHIVCSILPKYIAMAKCSTSSSSGWAKLFDMAKVSFSLQVEATHLQKDSYPLPYTGVARPSILALSIPQRVSLPMLSFGQI